MIDLSHLPNAPGRVEFFGPTGVGTNAWCAWTKPRGYTMLALYAFGAGQGGGGGRSGLSSANKGGGGGGGSGGVSRLIVPLFTLPDVLYYRISPGGNGGAGGTAGGAGSNGAVGGGVIVPQHTLVSVLPSSTVQYVLLQASTPTSGGVGGLTTGSAAGGPAGALTGGTSCPLSNLGQYLSIGGIAGTTAGLATGNNAGADFTFSTGSQISPGGGGGSSSTGSARGGQILTDGSPYPSSANTAVDLGMVGFAVNLGGPQPRWHGGTGGGGSDIVGSLHGGRGVTAGAGGGGGGGCLAGGGGGGGNGGDGGPGLVVFHCW